MSSLGAGKGLAQQAQRGGGAGGSQEAIRGAAQYRMAL
jgi:hypothetical protein